MFKETIKKDETFDRDDEQLIATEVIETTVYMEKGFFEVCNTAALWRLFVMLSVMSNALKLAKMDDET